eukprot:Lithocolla_globosa_v1_NODE_5940_length_1161_cov_4.361991.p1 type:complete len:266 gc:universal NODE_5940_length_1161_cov_4.361991:811-14(-)
MFVLPDHPTKCAWLTPSEQLYLIHRHPPLPEAEMLSWKTFKSILLSGHVWIFSIMFLFLSIAAYGSVFFLPAIISSFGYTSLEANLMTTPVYLVSAIVIVFTSYFSDKLGERGWFLILPMTVSSLGFFLLTFATYFDLCSWAYFATFLTIFYGGGIPVLLAWMSLTHRTAAEAPIASGLVVSIGNCGGLIGPNIYGLLYLTPFTDSSSSSEGSYALGHLTIGGILLINIIITILYRTILPSKFEPIDYEKVIEEKEPLLINAAEN